MKKGMSEVVSWVLLLGFTISLGVAVFTWTKSYTTTQTESTVSYIEGKVECQEIMINILVNKSIRPPCQGFTVSNRGRLKIDKILIRIFNNNDPVGSYIYNLSLNPLQNQYVFNSSLTGNKIEVMPLTMVSSKLVACREKTSKEDC